jgi:hypothetical protein
VFTSANLASYTYAANSPMVYGDPTGGSWDFLATREFWQGAAVGAAKGVAAGVVIGGGMVLLAAAAPAAATVVGFGLAGAGIALGAAEVYRIATAESEPERNRMIGEAVGGLAGGGVGYYGGRRVGEGAVNLIGGMMSGPRPHSLGAAAADEPPLTGPVAAAGASAAESNAARLARIANEVSDMLAPDTRAMQHRTVAVAETVGEANGPFAAIAGHDYTPAQLSLLARYGVTPLPFPGPGIHAEDQLLAYFAMTRTEGLGLFPRAMGTSRNICTAICQPAIEREGGTVLPGRRTAVWE